LEVLLKLLTEIHEKSLTVRNYFVVLFFSNTVQQKHKTKKALIFQSGLSLYWFYKP